MLLNLLVECLAFHLGQGCQTWCPRSNFLSLTMFWNKVKIEKIVMKKIALSWNSDNTVHTIPFSYWSRVHTWTGPFLGGLWARWLSSGDVWKRFVGHSQCRVMYTDPSFEKTQKSILGYAIMNHVMWLVRILALIGYGLSFTIRGL